MSKGLGRTQQGCLRVIRQYEEAGELPTTYNITAEVYQVTPDKNGNRLVSDAQHVATKRALEGLQRKGLIIGFRTGRARVPGFGPDSDGRTELCHHWMTDKRRASDWRPVRERSDHQIAAMMKMSPATVARVRKQAASK